tara:strand:+ start:451 stop:717 length:267 start_codon:yes stop_codon:yes gene_type:complete
MDINQLSKIVKKKIIENTSADDVIVEDKTFLHKKHKSFQKNRFHIRIIIKSNDLSSKNNIESTKLIYKILGEEIKKYIHSIQISFNKT